MFDKMIPFFLVLAKLSIASLSLTSPSLASSSLVAPTPNVPWPSSGPYAPPTFVGGNGGTAFIESGGEKVGHVVQRLEVWLSGSVVGIQLYYNDGSTGGVHGQKNTQPDNHGTIAFQPGEKITTADIYSDKDGNHAGRLVLNTNRGQKLDIGADVGQPKHQIDIGSGILVGVTGRASAGIDALGLIFLASIGSVSISKVTFPQNPSETSQDISKVQLTDAVRFGNDADFPIQRNFDGKVVKTNNNTFTQSSGHSWGVEASIEATLFDLFQDPDLKTIYWQQQPSKTHNMSESIQVPFSWSMVVRVPPHGVMWGKTLCSLGQLRHLSYTSTVTVTMQDPKLGNFTFPENGTYGNNIYAYNEAYYSPGGPNNGPVANAPVQQSDSIEPIALSTAAVSATKDAAISSLSTDIAGIYSGAIARTATIAVS